MACKKKNKDIFSRIYNKKLKIHNSFVSPNPKLMYDILRMHRTNCDNYLDSYMKRRKISISSHNRDLMISFLLKPLTMCRNLNMSWDIENAPDSLDHVDRDNVRLATMNNVFYSEFESSPTSFIDEKTMMIMGNSMIFHTPHAMMSDIYNTHHITRSDELMHCLMKVEEDNKLIDLMLDAWVDATPFRERYENNQNMIYLNCSLSLEGTYAKKSDNFFLFIRPKNIFFKSKNRQCVSFNEELIPDWVERFAEWSGMAIDAMNYSSDDFSMPSIGRGMAIHKNIISSSFQLQLLKMSSDGIKPEFMEYLQKVRLVMDKCPCLENHSFHIHEYGNIVIPIFETTSSTRRLIHMNEMTME